MTSKLKQKKIVILKPSSCLILMYFNARDDQNQGNWLDNDHLKLPGFIKISNIVHLVKPIYISLRFEKQLNH